ncbi:MAG: hypothetical protein AB1726_08815 [Planctomycetota bacterium]
MKPILRLRALALPALLLAAALLPGDAPAFHPALAVSLVKTFAVRAELSLDDVSMTVNGEEQDPTALGLPADLRATLRYEAGATDTYAKVEGGRPLDFQRSFDAGRFGFESSTGDSDAVIADQVVGKTARFVWDEAAGEYTRSIEGEDAGEAAEVLAFIHPDLELSLLLPAGEVEKGDEWTVRGLALVPVLLPGVDLEKILVEKPADVFAGESAREAIADAILAALKEIEATCTWGGTVEEDGVSLGVIEFAGTIDRTLDLDPTIWVHGAEGVELEGSHLRVTIELDLEGECRWDLGAGHFRSFTATGSGTAAVAIGVEIPGELELELEGEAELSLELAYDFASRAE